MVRFHLGLLGVECDDEVINLAAHYTDTVPRVIKNMAITMRDWMSGQKSITFGVDEWEDFVQWSSIKKH